MKRYRFEANQRLITAIEVVAETESEARGRVFRQDKYVAPFDTLYGDTQVVLRSVEDD